MMSLCFSGDIPDLPFKILQLACVPGVRKHVENYVCIVDKIGVY